MDDALTQGSFGPRINIFRRDFGLDCGCVGHRIDVATRQGRAPIEEVSLVEVDMGFHEPATDKPTASVICRTVRVDARLDRNDAPILYSDVDELA
jgi:hypothetical protein